MMGFTSDISSFIDFGIPQQYRVEGGIINDTSTIILGINDDFFWSTNI